MDDNCENSLESVKDEKDPAPWPPTEVSGETTISVRIGPTGGKRGYTVRTDHPSWGIAWYLNDKLIPELIVERGQTYTFVVEGGNEPANPAKYHPFYITDSPEGGFLQQTEATQLNEKVYAGIEYGSDGYRYPTAGTNAFIFDRII